MNTGSIDIYQNEDGTQIDVQFDQETVWLSQLQMAEVFGKDVRTVNEHIQNILSTGELSQDPTIRKFRIVRQEGKRQVTRNIDHYNLDMIISVGYRVNSVRGTQFRQWATRRLKDYLIEGYSINEKRLAQKQQEVNVLKDGIQILSRVIEEKANDPDNSWLPVFARGLSLLDDYDHEALDEAGKTTRNTIYPELTAYQSLIEDMRDEFNSDIFGQEKDDNFRGSVAQITKGFGERDFYPSLEEKAAMLLYLIVKNHSFVDGNKRIAAACFLKFLEANNLLFNERNKPIISNDGLASLTLFVASSKSDEMETVKKLIVSVLNRGPFH